MRLSLGYLFHSSTPCFHSFIKIIVKRTKKIVLIIVVIFIVLFINIVGIRNEISTSKIINISVIKKKLVEKANFLGVILLKPHSKVVFFSLFLSLFSVMLLNTNTNSHANEMAVVIVVKLFIGFFLFNWKLNVQCYTYKPLFYFPHQ